VPQPTEPLRQAKYQDYAEEFTEDLFSEETKTAGEELMTEIRREAERMDSTA